MKLINENELDEFIKTNPYCKHAVRELQLAGYDPDDNGANGIMYRQVLESVAVFASHGNSESSGYYELELLGKLCRCEVLSPLTLSDDEWDDGWNTRAPSIYKDETGIKELNSYYCIADGEKFFSRLYETYDGKFTGRYFFECFIKPTDKGYMPKPPIGVNCKKLVVSPKLTISICNDRDLYKLSGEYHIDWHIIPELQGLDITDTKVKDYVE